MKKLIFIIIICFIYFPSYAQSDQKKDSLFHILNNSSISFESRCDSAINLIRTLAPSKQQELFDELIHFTDEDLKDGEQKDTYKAQIYRNLSFLYRDMGDNAAMLNAIATAVDLIENSSNLLEKAVIYQDYGQKQSYAGNLDQGHEYLYKAIELYKEVGEQEEGISISLGILSMGFREIQDTIGFKRNLEEMKENLKTVKSSYIPFYNYYANMGVYYGLLIEVAGYTPKRVDSALYYMKKAASIIEENSDKMIKGPIVSYDYFNIANMYSNHFENKNDSIRKYLDKALNAIPIYLPEDYKSEIKVNVKTMIGRQELKAGNYNNAEKEILEVIELIHSIEDYPLWMEYKNACELLIAIYQQSGKPEQALVYCQELLEHERKRFDKEKVETINEMATKYEVEKKETQMKFLEQKNRIAWLIIILCIAVLAVLIISILFIIRYFRLRKKNMEHEIYESALLSELQQNELQQNKEEKEYLLRQYNELEKIVNENEEKSILYKNELQDIKQRLEQKPTKSMINKIEEWIRQSTLTNEKKELYLNRLSTLDVDILEQGYLAADENITNMDMKYIICFYIEMEVKDISLLFIVEPASVRTVRYRIKKKFKDKDTFKFLF